MEKDEIKLFDLINKFVNGDIDFDEFNINWDECFVESNEHFQFENFLDEVKDRLDYTSNLDISERDKLDGLISVSEFKLYVIKALNDLK